MTQKKSVMMLVAFYGLCLLVQAAGGLITASSVGGWYQTLVRSELTPPGAAFGIAWSILYALMAVAAWRVWRIQSSLSSMASLCSMAQKLWLAQLFAGLAWNIIFFGMMQVQAGFAIIACVWGLAVLCMIRFSRIDRLAGRLMMPLVGWLTFATYLQGFIALHN